MEDKLRIDRHDLRHQLQTAAFCEKHDAHCEYKMENNMFSLRILVLE